MQKTKEYNTLKKQLHVQRILHRKKYFFLESDVNVAVLSLKKFVVSYLNFFVDGHGYINNDSHSTKLKGGGLTKLFLSQFCLCCVDLSLQNKVCTEG